MKFFIRHLNIDYSLVKNSSLTISITKLGTLNLKNIFILYDAKLLKTQLSGLQFRFNNHYIVHTCRLIVLNDWQSSFVSYSFNCSTYKCHFAFYELSQGL